MVERRRKKEEGRVIEERKERAKWWGRENLRVEKKREGESEEEMKKV